MEHRPIEPEFFALGWEPSGNSITSTVAPPAVDDSNELLVLDLTELEPLPKALVGSYLIG